MFEELNLKPTITDMNSITKTISILKETLILKNGQVISRTSDRCAFIPGDIDKVKQYMGIEEGPEIDYLNAIWTPEVIQEYQNLIVQNDI